MKRVQIIRDPMPYGSVLIVDDVETNIYVATGLLAPYGMRTDSAYSGFEAIEKIRSGNVYDIIFMDHMMPKMDGIQATGIIRSLGYEGAIVALTANAISGQADIFLGNGFDDFISKPIDIRQMNSILNKYVRDKQPAETIKEANRQEREETEREESERPGDDELPPSPDPHMVEIFIRDALKTIASLETLVAKNDYTDSTNLRNYIINIHGINSARANVGRMDLSAAALKLETAGRDNRLDIVIPETNGFLRALKDFVDGLSSKEEEDMAESDEDKRRLAESLMTIKAACGEFDESTANEVLNELRNTVWPKETKKLLSVISEHLLHSDFDEAAEAIDRFI